MQALSGNELARLRETLRPSPVALLQITASQAARVRAQCLLVIVVPVHRCGGSPGFSPGSLFSSPAEGRTSTDGGATRRTRHAGCQRRSEGPARPVPASTSDAHPRQNRESLDSLARSCQELLETDFLYQYLAARDLTSSAR